MQKRKIRTGASNSGGQPLKTNGQAGNAPQSVPWPAEAARVRELSTGGHSKSAVEIAKELHKRFATAESESLLLEAYESRIRAFLKQGLAVEAKSLLDLVTERFPSVRSRLLGVQFDVLAGRTNLDELVSPLADSALSPALQEKIEAAVRQRVDNLSSLASVSSLPPEHPLRAGAVALVAALEAVTRGPVEDSALLLPEISRRSPLASWKALVNAIACFYRREDDACEKWLRAIANDSVPARLVPSLEAMIGAGAGEGCGQRPAALNLMILVGAGSDVLRTSLASLEEALLARKKKKILEQAREAIQLCHQYCPELSERLRQHIAVRCMFSDIGPNSLFAAIGFEPREDAYYLRLRTRGLEQIGGEAEWGLEIVAGWEDFRRHALQENWFVSDSLEDAVLSCHMAQILGRVPAEILEEMREKLNARPIYGKRKGASLAELYSPDKLYERASRGDPHPEVFRAWLDWAKNDRDWRVPDRVAELWRAARQADVSPLLWLTESAEKRGAYKKSLSFLEEAERIDRLDPAVRKAKLRLLVAATLGHFCQCKPHLAAREIDQIEALPDASEMDRSALVIALRQLCAVLGRDREQAKIHASELERRLGGVASAALLNGLVQAGKLSSSEVSLTPLHVESVHTAILLAGVAYACSIAASVGILLTIPVAWEKSLRACLGTSYSSLDTSHILVLGEAALRSGMFELAFAISSAGLTKGGADARHLCLRAQSLPGWEYERRHHCLCAALELARRERNADVTGKILDLLKGHAGRMHSFDPFSGGFSDSTYTLEAEMLNRVLEEERKRDSFPLSGHAKPRYIRDLRILKERNAAAAEDFWDEDNESTIPGSLPAEIERELKEAVGADEEPGETLARILFDMIRPLESGRGKKRKSPSPDQGDLF